MAKPTRQRGSVRDDLARKVVEARDNAKRMGARRPGTARPVRRPARPLAKRQGY